MQNTMHIIESDKTKMRVPKYYINDKALFEPRK